MPSKNAEALKRIGNDGKKYFNTFLSVIKYKIGCVAASARFHNKGHQDMNYCTMQLHVCICAWY